MLAIVHNLREDISGGKWSRYGYSSAEAYLRDCYGMVYCDLTEEARSPIVRAIYEDGFSANVIAAVFNVSAPTAARYIDLADPKEPTLLTGLDGANRPNKRAHLLAASVSGTTSKPPYPSVRAGLTDLDKCRARLMRIDSLTPEEVHAFTQRLSLIGSELEKFNQK